MRPHSWLLTLLTSTLLSGCVVVPMNRTYYEPNAADGTPIRSSSCGWNATSRDALERDVAGVTVSVYPTYEPGRPLRIYILLSRSDKTVEIVQENVEIKVGDGPQKYRPTAVKIKDAGPYFFKSIDYEFPIADSASEIAVVFSTGFIKVNGHDMEILPFRFNRVTKSDVFYGSINC